MCDDLESEIAALRAKGVGCTRWLKRGGGGSLYMTGKERECAKRSGALVCFSTT